MTWVIVPNEVHDAIYAKVDAKLAEHPDATPDREIYYQALLNHYYLNGVIPDFDLVKQQFAALGESTKEKT